MADQGVVCSLSCSGNVWDNAAMEGFFSSLKTERTARKTYRTRDEAKANAFDYIECFYNPKTPTFDNRISELHEVREAGRIIRRPSTEPDGRPTGLRNDSSPRYKAPLPNLENETVKKIAKRRAWTAGDTRTLKALARKKTKAGKIAKTLKRTEGATRQKAFSLGVSLDARI